MIAISAEYKSGWLACRGRTDARASLSIDKKGANSECQHVTRSGVMSCVIWVNICFRGHGVMVDKCDRSLVQI